MTPERMACITALFPSPELRLRDEAAHECLKEIKRLEKERDIALSEWKTFRDTPVGVAVTHSRRLEAELAHVYSKLAECQDKHKA
jgi:hypothetical protein